MKIHFLYHFLCGKQKDSRRDSSSIYLICFLFIVDHLEKLFSISSLFIKRHLSFPPNFSAEVFARASPQRLQPTDWRQHWLWHRVLLHQVLLDPFSHSPECADLTRNSETIKEVGQSNNNCHHSAPAILLNLKHPQKGQMSIF